MTSPDRQRVKSAFSRQAHRYESHTNVQKWVVERFLERFVEGAAPPSRFVDIGLGTGMLLQRMMSLYPESVAVGLDMAMGMLHVSRQRFAPSQCGLLTCGDAEYLPFCGEVFDLVVSTSTYQWLDPLRGPFAEAYRVLVPGGRFCFAFFGERTLHELRAAEQVARSRHLLADRNHRFASREVTLAALESAGFSDCRVEAESLVESHDDVRSLIRSLKVIGAGSGTAWSGRGLSARPYLETMNTVYQHLFARDGRLPATFEILFCSAVRK
jgi:malonyl-CoA O-methyltransferase